MLTSVKTEGTAAPIPVLLLSVLVLYPACGTGMTIILLAFRLSVNYTAKMDKKYYEEDNHGYTAKSTYGHDSRISNVIDALKTNLEPGDRVLDIGCGDLYLQELLPDYEFTGLDINPQHPKAIKQDITQTPYPLPVSEFNAIVCSEVLEHLFSPLDVLKEARRLIRPTGVLVVTVPNFDAIEGFMTHFRGYLYDRRNMLVHEHIRQYNIDSITKLLSEAGFHVDHYVGNSPNMSLFFTKARDTLFKRMNAMQPSTKVEVDQLLGKMFPDWCPGLLIEARPNV